MQFLNYNQNIIKNIDKISLGGIKTTSNITTKSNILKNEIDQIKNIDEKRAKEVIDFYNDLMLCIYQLDNLLKENGYICLVVGNRTVKNIQLSTDLIIIDLFKSLKKYTHIETIIRSIPNKRLSKLNSPSNIKGKKCKTMNEEYIIVLQKSINII